MALYLCMTIRLRSCNSLEKCRTELSLAHVSRFELAEDMQIPSVISVSVVNLVKAILFYNLCNVVGCTGSIY